MNKQIIFNIDKNYIYPFLVAASSIEDTNNVNDIKITLMSVDIPVEAQSIIKNIINIDMDIVDISPHVPDNFPKNMFYTKTVYAKLYLEKVFETSDNFLYLDPDIMVMDDLSYLFSIDLESYPLAAVQSPTTPVVSGFYGVPYWKELGLDPRTKYLNSGVMLINYNRWIELKIPEFALQHVNDYGGRFLLADQDILNTRIAGNFQRLPMRWNQETPLRLPDHGHQAYLVHDDLEINEAINNPAIVHFTGAYEGKSKPWLGKNIDPYQNEWMIKMNKVKEKIKKYLKSNSF